MDLHDAEHWDAAYAGGDERCSWTQAWPTRSMAAIRAVAPGRHAPIIDVGGGSSRLAAALLDAGHDDVTVLDVSPAALNLARRRMGDDAGRVEWIVADVLTWRPARRYAVWHDRAMLHFLTDRGQRRRYAEQVRAALAPGGHAVIATFTPDGPRECSGLPVHRSSADELVGLLGEEFAPVVTDTEEHRTPAGTREPYLWLVARRGPEA